MNYKIILISLFFTSLISCKFHFNIECEYNGFYNGDGYIGSNQCNNTN